MSNITETQQDSTVQDSATKEFAKLLEESFEINQLKIIKIKINQFKMTKIEIA